MHRDRRDERSEAEDQPDVGDVRAIGIAEGDARIALPRGNRGDEEFRGGCAEAHHHHADQERGHAEMPGEAGGAGDEAVRAPDETRQTEGDRGEGHEQRHGKALSDTGREHIGVAATGGKGRAFGR